MRFLESDEEKIMITYTFINLLISIILEQFHKKIQFKLRKNSKRIIFSEVEVILQYLDFF